MKIRNTHAEQRSHWDYDSNNQFMQVQFAKQSHEIEGKRLSLKQKISKRLPKRLLNHNLQIRTEPVELERKSGLPQINLAGLSVFDIRSRELDKSQKILRKSTKNTKILTQMIGRLIIYIEILRDPKFNDDGIQINISKRKNKKTILTESCNNNQFLQEQKKQQSKFQRSGPKVIHPQFIKLCNQGKISRRKIYSQQRSRVMSKNSMGLYRQNNSQEDAPMLTFYKPTRNYPQANTEPMTTIRKDINKDLRIQI